MNMNMKKERKNRQCSSRLTTSLSLTLHGLGCSLTDKREKIGNAVADLQTVLVLT